ncbi:molybdopterin cofactor-binding domain-containing protein [Nonomuraea endophytica]|uniref:molybdopterin cofactor-binding domain-containing protein n=1 Tax=Nonomuraea endophytica TaxID=714136 RepID=UPI0037C8E157
MIGWAGRDPRPRSGRDGGTGAAAILTQIAADGIGLQLDMVRVEYGDTDLPFLAASVGSSGATAGGNAVHVAVTGLREQLIAQAVADEGSPRPGAGPAAVTVTGGVMTGPDGSESYGQMLSRNFVPETDYLGSYQHQVGDDYALLNFGAQFAEVAVDADLGSVRRMVGVFAPGRVLNAKTARSQLMGGMLWAGRRRCWRPPTWTRATGAGPTRAWGTTWCRSTPTRPT